MLENKTGSFSLTFFECEDSGESILRFQKISEPHARFSDKPLYLLVTSRFTFQTVATLSIQEKDLSEIVSGGNYVLDPNLNKILIPLNIWEKNKKTGDWENIYPDIESFSCTVYKPLGPSDPAKKRKNIEAFSITTQPRGLYSSELTMDFATSPVSMEEGIYYDVRTITIDQNDPLFSPPITFQL